MTVKTTRLLLVLGAFVAGLIVCFGVVILLLANSERAGLVPPGWLLRPLVYLGEISYSTYMLHLLLGKAYFNALSRLAGYDPHVLPAGQVVLAILLMVLASAVTFHLVEQPGRQLLRAAFRRLGSRRAKAAAAY